MTGYTRYSSEEHCIQSLGESAYAPSNSAGLYCNGTWDTLLCWPAAPAGETIKLNCPPLKGLDVTQFAYKTCADVGLWQGSEPGNYSNPRGWTNYNGCYSKEVRDVLHKVYSHPNPHLKLAVAENTRILEMVGLTISLACLLVSLVIFCCFRSLKCSRTRIHRHLFVAMLIQVVIRLTIYSDQYRTRSSASGPMDFSTQTTTVAGIDNTPVLCEMFYVLLEYARTAMFMWFLLEGITLHNLVVIAVFSGKPNYIIYYLVGWGCPVFLTGAWAITTGMLYKGTVCWFGYNLLRIFWILEGPRIAVIILNIVFLLNIIRVLITKMRATHSSEAEQVRKGALAAIVLVPLLGITNALGMVPAPLDSHVLVFALWAFGSHFLVSFQGFFVSLIYCFLNGEVRQTVNDHWMRFRMGNSFSGYSRRASRTLTTFYSAADTNDTHNSTRQSGQPSPRVLLRSANNGGNNCVGYNKVEQTGV